ncbi:cell division protein FtsA [Rubellicoccus peritrichatus]|uniref:Cell division protein FtsA n=1 Tax=Rubellicoccus peritrichatus TaxID=3080537 RepID=A0AAQ3LDU6_9BACT|nr:cell division protein FtsA [Puniceicoccus sp. CR14]WOO43557.1 cell division protein FtsA [Puniceicoccus sp. CR14]
MSQSKIVGAVEIGTTKTVVLVGEIVNGRSLNIVGMGQSSSAGVKKGEILDFRAASNATHAAIMGAEKSAGATIEAIYLAQTGRHLDGFANNGSVTVSSADGIVSKNDINRATKEGKGKELPAGRVYIHHIKNQVTLDGRAVEEPLRMQGQRLDIGYWSIHGDERRVRDHIHVINGFGLPVEDMIISSIATGSMVASEEEKKAGVLVLDIGCGTTDWVLYQNGFITRTGVVAVGGDHFTNDLALGLRINHRNAEKLKVQCGSAIMGKDDQTEKVWMVGDQMIGDRHIPKKALIQIISARCEELFSIIKKQLGDYCSVNALPAGVVITGGGSQLDGIVEAASRGMGVEARIGQNPQWVMEELRGPEFSTPLGLLHYALTGQHQEEFMVQEEKGILRKVVKMISG